MYNPKDVFTEEGYEDYRAHLRNVEKGIEHILGRVDDLHIGANRGDTTTPGLLAAVLKLVKKGGRLQTGDGEVYE